MGQSRRNWCERGAKEAVWVRAKNPSINCNGGSRITLSCSWNRSINTLRSFSPFSKIPEVKNQPEDHTNTSCHNNHSLKED